MVVGRTGEGHMDDVTSAIAALVTGSSPKKMSAAQIDAAVMHLVDALGCAIAATETPPYGVVRDIAAKTPSLRGSSVIGSKTFCSPEMAAFANTCMVRALDFNDTTIPGAADIRASCFPASWRLSRSADCRAPPSFTAFMSRPRFMAGCAIRYRCERTAGTREPLSVSPAPPVYLRFWVRARMLLRMRPRSAFPQVCTWASSALARSPPERLCGRARSHNGVLMARLARRA